MGVLQPDYPHAPDRALECHLAQLYLTRSWVEPGSVDLVVWPENAILDGIWREGAYLDDLQWLSAEIGAPILLGAQTPSPEDGLRPQNSVVGSSVWGWPNSGSYGE